MQEINANFQINFCSGVLSFLLEKHLFICRYSGVLRHISGTVVLSPPALISSQLLSSIRLFFLGRAGRSRRPHRAGPPMVHIRPEGRRTRCPLLTAGQGRPVCQPWHTGDMAGEQRPEAMPSSSLLLSDSSSPALSGKTSYPGFLSAYSTKQSPIFFLRRPFCRCFFRNKTPVFASNTTG
jgi:hypothetical protein